MWIPITRWRCEQFHQSGTNADNGCQIINAQIHSDQEESTVESNKDNMVSLEKKSPEERLNICRKYYLGGFAFLPLLWLINAIWFYKQAFKVEPYPQQAQIRTCKNNFDCFPKTELNYFRCHSKRNRYTSLASSYYHLECFISSLSH